jgi:transposase
MAEYSEVFVAFDVAKRKHAVAIAEGGRTGEVRFLGEIENSAATIERVIKRLAGRYDRLHVCFEAGPTGYELYRHIRDLGHDCMVVAPALIPKRPGEHVKTNRRDAITLARLHRAGELTAVWVPDAVHEAVRDLVRAREAAADDLRRKRQQLLSFLLRRGRIYSGGGHWTLAHRRWLAKQAFEHTAQQIVFQEGIDAIEDAVQRLHRLEQQLAAIVPSWSMAPAVAAYQAMRGASFLVAVTFAAEIGDVRRFDTPPADVLPRPGAGGELDRRHSTTQGPNPGRQSTCPPGIGRGCLDIPLSRQGQRNPESPHRGIAEDGARHRLESTAPTVCSLSSAQCCRQEAARGGGSHCSRNGSIPVGHRS